MSHRLSKPASPETARCVTELITTPHINFLRKKEACFLWFSTDFLQKKIWKWRSFCNPRSSSSETGALKLSQEKRKLDFHPVSDAVFPPFKRQIWCFTFVPFHSHFDVLYYISRFTPTWTSTTSLRPTTTRRLATGASSAGRSARGRQDGLSRSGVSVSR